MKDLTLDWNFGRTKVGLSLDFLLEFVEVVYEGYFDFDSSLGEEN